MDFREWVDATGLIFDVNDSGGYVYWVPSAVLGSGVRMHEHLRNLTPTACRVLIDSGSSFGLPSELPVAASVLSYSPAEVEAEYPDAEGWFYWSDACDGMVYRVNTEHGVFAPVAFWPDMRTQFRREGARSEKYIFSVLARRMAGKDRLESISPELALAQWLKPPAKRNVLREVIMGVLGVLWLIVILWVMYWSD